MENKIYKFGPKNYQITILKTDKPIPDGEMDTFMEWLDNQVSEMHLGNNCEYFSHNANFEDDIKVEYLLELVDDPYTLDEFIKFLGQNNWVIKLKNPNYTPGEEDSQPEFYNEYDTVKALDNFTLDLK